MDRRACGRRQDRAFACDYDGPLCSLLLLLPECWVGQCVCVRVRSLLLLLPIVLATQEQGNLFAQ